MSMSDIQKHLTEPPIPVGGYAKKTMSDEEIGRLIKEQADMCMSILNGGENEMMGWCPYDGEECHHDGYCDDCPHNKREGDSE